MKGTKIFDNLQDYSIECNQADKDNPFLLNLNFTYKGKKRPSALLDKFANDIHREQFLPWLDNSVK